MLHGYIHSRKKRYTHRGRKAEYRQGRGPHIKFREHVDHITFSGENSLDKGKQHVIYITERAVFALLPEGLTLIEIAPGADLEKDILGKMDFTPVISKDLRLMDERLFRPEKMGISLKK